MLLVLFFSTRSQKTNDAVAIQQLSKHDWGSLLAAACGDLGTKEHGRADSVNLNTTEAGLSQCQPFDLFRDTIWPSWLCAGKDARGCSTCQPSFSCRSFSLIFHCETTLCREHLKTEMRFHGRFKAVIKQAVFSEIIQHFDTFIVFCLIYGFLLHNIFMLLFFLQSSKIWLFLHTLFYSLMQNILMNKLLTNKPVWIISAVTNKSHYHFYIMTALIALITVLSWAWSVILLFTATIAPNNHCQEKTTFTLM